MIQTHASILRKQVDQTASLFGEQEDEEDGSASDRPQAKPRKVQVMEPTNDDRWRVRVGPLPARVEADQVALRLKSEEKLSTWVIRHTGS
ncbi:MAG: hypothetical protein CMN75_11260 [Spirochaeta sp.]|nr:hypothetical protein [Spirochaeta sp.]RPG08269.1 MAG: SPOR domain-containing protein [Proteobacteria bacterium TMED72]